MIIIIIIIIIIILNIIMIIIIMALFCISTRWLFTSYLFGIKDKRGKNNHGNQEYQNK